MGNNTASAAEQIILALHVLRDVILNYNRIKISQIGKIESLNVSVACGIFLYHISKIK